MDKQTAEVLGASIAYTDTGKGRPVVLLHGFCGSSAYWEEIIPLLQEELRVIVPDLRGHGASTAPDSDYSMEALADDVLGLLDSLQLEKAAVLGHSLGGYVTLALAEKHAERLSAFGLIHSTAFPDDEKGREGRLKSMATIREQGLPAFLEGLIPRLFAPKHLATLPEAVEKARRIGLGTSEEGAIRTLEGMRERPDRAEVIAKSRVPVLLAAGEDDQIVAPARTFTASGPHIRQVLIHEAGHMSMLEAPRKLAEEILSFFKNSP